MKVKNFRSNSTMTFLFIVTTTLLFSSCASFISTMESTDWKKTTNDNIELLNDAMQTGSNKDSETRSHTDGFRKNNVKCLKPKGICSFVPNSSAYGF